MHTDENLNSNGDKPKLHDANLINPDMNGKSTYYKNLHENTNRKLEDFIKAPTKEQHSDLY